jgi:hypothetical protein
MPEYSSLDGVYEKHFELVAEEEYGGKDEALQHLSLIEGSLLGRAMSVSGEGSTEDKD